MSTKLINFDSINTVISEMSTEEKALLVIGNTTMTTVPMEKYGIPALLLLDGATGINTEELFPDIVTHILQDPEGEIKEPVSQRIFTEISQKLPDVNALSAEAKKVYDAIHNYLIKNGINPVFPSCFPSGMLLGATWNKDVVYACGKAVGKEFVSYDIDVLLGPNVNIHRDPRNGRVYEGYSEDPVLASKLAPCFVKGVQSEGVLADAKHFAANSQETCRQTVNEKISLRALNEIYFPAFKACVDAGMETIMSAYNGINGESCAMNRWLLKDVLREEWGFEGTVITDWGAAYDVVKSIHAWNDLIMPGKRDIKPILDAIQNGSLDESDLNKCVEDVLRMVLKSNKFNRKTQLPEIDVKYSESAAYDCTKEGIVLLKNEKVLPVDQDTKLDFFGKGSMEMQGTGDGSTLVHTDRTKSLIAECEKYGKCNYGSISENSDLVVITVISSGNEGNDRNGLELNEGEREMALDAISKAKAHNKRILLVLNIAGPVDLAGIEENCDAIICAFLPGQEGGRALADVIFGKVNPSGKLPITFPRRVQDVPAFLNFPGTTNEVVYGEGVFVGYRYYDYKEIKPRYPFGYGLSYTNFEICIVGTNKKKLLLDEQDKIIVEVKVSNIGDHDGSEVVQMYIQDPLSSMPMPVKELKGFEKVFLHKGESKRISFEIDYDTLKSYSEEFEQFCVEPGTFNILIGDSSDSITDSISIEVEGNSVFNFSDNTPLIKLLADDRARKILHKYIEDICHWDYTTLDDPAQYLPFKPIKEVMADYFPISERKEEITEMYRELKQYYLRDCDRNILKKHIVNVSDLDSEKEEEE